MDNDCKTCFEAAIDRAERRGRAGGIEVMRKIAADIARQCCERDETVEKIAYAIEQVEVE
jgi:hypothetical protein